MPQIANGDSGAAARALINFVLPRTVAFATTPPLDGNAVMAARTVAGALAFAAPASPVLGAQCQLRLTADGANAPSFAGFVEHGSSAGYLNTLGVVNLLRFWHDGATSWFAVSQALNAVPFVMQSAAIANGTPTQIQIGFDRTLNASIVPAASAFAVTNSGGADTISSVSVAGAIVTLTKSRTTAPADVVGIAYIAPATNPLTDANGNVAGSSAIAATNNVGGAAAVDLRFGGLSNMTETADGSGYDYIETAANDYGPSAGRGVASVGIPANADGYVEFTANGIGQQGPMLGLTTGTTYGNYTDNSFYFWLDNHSGAQPPLSIGAGANVGLTGATQPTNPAANDRWRLNRTSGVVTVQWKPAGSGAYQTLYTFAGTSTAKLYPTLMIASTAASARALLPQASSNVA